MHPAFFFFSYGMAVYCFSVSAEYFAGKKVCDNFDGLRQPDGFVSACSGIDGNQRSREIDLIKSRLAAGPAMDFFTSEKPSQENRIRKRMADHDGFMITELPLRPRRGAVVMERDDSDCSSVRTARQRTAHRAL